MAPTPGLSSSASVQQRQRKRWSHRRPRARSIVQSATEKWETSLSTIPGYDAHVSHEIFPMRGSSAYGFKNTDHAQLAGHPFLPAPAISSLLAVGKAPHLVAAPGWHLPHRAL